MVDEAFLDAVPGEAQTWLATELDGLLVIRSLTKQWAIPGIRAGYVDRGPGGRSRRLACAQPPWSVSSPRRSRPMIAHAARRRKAAMRARELTAWRDYLEGGLA